MTLYTAVGAFKIENGKGGRHPLVTSDGKGLPVDIPEMVIWVILNNRFLDMQSLEKMYQRRIEAFGLEGVPDCGAYIDRMLQRGLIAEGHGSCGHDALFDLLSDLRIIPIACGFTAKFSAFIKLLFHHRMPLCKAAGIFKKQPLSYCEKEILTIAARAHITAAEAIMCIEHGHKEIAGDADLLAALYSDEYTTSDNIGGEARLCVNEHSCLTAIANLYLRRLVTLEL